MFRKLKYILKNWSTIDSGKNIYVLPKQEINFPKTLQEYSEAVRKANTKWWTDLHTGEPIKRNTGEMLMLITSEIAEALEGHRKNLDDTHLTQYKMFPIELVDAIIRIFDLCAAPIEQGGAGITNLDQLFHEKMTYNATRKDHSREHRLSENGKKY